MLGSGIKCGVRGPLGSEVPLVSDKLPRAGCRASIDLLAAVHLLVGVPRPIRGKRAPGTGLRGVLAFNLTHSILPHNATA